MALRNHPRISAGLKRRVQAEAKRLDYRPDPMMSALSSYRQRNRPAANRAVSIALLMPFTDWKSELFWFREVYRGIESRARALGYEFQIHPYPTTGMEGRTLDRRLRNIGVHGLLMGPSYEGGNAYVPVEKFAAVRLSHSIQDSRLSISSHDHFHGMQMACEQAFAKGYRNPAYIYDEALEGRLGNRWLASFAVNTSACPNAEPSQRSFGASMDAERAPPQIRSWLEALEPDCLIAPSAAMLHPHFLRLDDALARWKTLGRIVLTKENRRDAEVTGVLQNFHVLGHVGVDLLHAQMLEQKSGIPDYPRRVFIRGTWADGRTLPHVVKGQYTDAPGNAPA